MKSQILQQLDWLDGIFAVLKVASLADNGISDRHISKAKAAIEAKITETEKAYGGCHNCYGKGYATVNAMWSGDDTDQDIGSPGGRVSGGNPNVMKFCTCSRGMQLETKIAKRETAARIGELAHWASFLKIHL